jgi:hypothetical protein
MHLQCEILLIMGYPSYKFGYLLPFPVRAVPLFLFPLPPADAYQSDPPNPHRASESGGRCRAAPHLTTSYPRRRLDPTPRPRPLRLTPLTLTRVADIAVPLYPRHLSPVRQSLASCVSRYELVWFHQPISYTSTISGRAPSRSAAEVTGFFPPFENHYRYSSQNFSKSLSCRWQIIRRIRLVVVQWAREMQVSPQLVSAFFSSSSRSSSNLDMMKHIRQ